jgi:lipopolysaccharide transport system ATP-binding protein
MSIAIKFENISKQYRLGLVSTRTLSHDLNRWWKTNILRQEDPYLKIGEVNDRSKKGESEYVWALRNISFEVEQGDVLGIIGKNGAGKSTLLKILSKVTSPTTGTIKAKGRIASLLEVGTGFHPELTGRENIYMNGAIMGMTKAEITRKLDEIVDFSGVERYLDTPTKRYSSGMTVRLGFAIAAHLDPEILVVDEVLAVGDAEFQKKAIGKMQDVSKGEGRTVLFVSHNMGSVRNLCNKGLVLKDGAIEFSGIIEDAINTYQNTYYNDIKTSWTNLQKRKTPYVTIEEFTLLDENKKYITDSIKNDDKILLNINFTCDKIAPDITIGFSLFDEKERLVYRALNTDLNPQINDKLKKGFNTLITELDISFLKPGKYRVIADVSRHNSEWIINPFVEENIVLTFEKIDTIFSNMKQSGNAIISPVIPFYYQ